MVASSVLACMMLAACGGGGGGASSTPSPPPPPVVPTNQPPTISGNPPTSVTVGQAYAFQPTANDPEGHALQFSITNKPSWATFSATTGQLTGTPTASNVGSYPGISITVSDGTSTVSLPAFSIAVNPSPIGTAELLWVPPTLNEDGSPVTNLAGYKVRYGQSPASLTQVVDIPTATTTSVRIEGLAAGIWYFTVSAYTTNGVESLPTGPVTKTIG